MRSFSILGCLACLACLALPSLAGGCGPGPTQVSCEIGADAGPAVANICTMYDGEPVNAVTSFDEGCEGVAGSGCSPVGALGTCLTPAPYPYVTTVTQYYYSWGDGNAQAACQACTSVSNTVPGTWTTPEMTTPVRDSASCPP